MVRAESPEEKARKLAIRLEVLFGSLTMAAISAVIAYLIHSFDGWVTFIYWFFCVLAIMSVIRAFWGVVTAKNYMNMIAIFWLAFFLNIILQVFILKN